jgi:heterodisulfide reductase subunit A
MHTAKQVKVAKTLEPDLDVTVYFMDIRTHGKDFDPYFDEVEAMPGVTYRRSMVSAVYQRQQTRDLLLTTTAEDGAVTEEPYDMVVLVVGFSAPEGVQALGKSLGVALNDYGFGVTGTFAPDESSRPGVFVTGSFREPKDIPETVVEASAAAASAASLLRAGAGPEAEDVSAAKEEERDVTWEWPKVGVFLCDRGGQLGEGIDLEAVAEHTRSLRDVGLVEVLQDGFTSAEMATVAQMVQDQTLNRVVLAGTTDLSLQVRFREMMRMAGLNPNLLEQVNLRGEIVWAPGENGRGPTEKAKELLTMAVSGAVRRQPFQQPSESVSQRVLVVGGGLAGLTAALRLAEMGYSVDLVERSDTLGGQLRHLRILMGDEDPQQALTVLLERLSDQPRISVHLNTEVAAIGGRLGRFEAELSPAEDEPVEATYGAVILATGGREVEPTEYLHGEDARVMTQRQLEQQLAAGEPAPSNVVMIQCVGSREPQRPYCSRTCCTKAVVNALAVKERNPGARVTVLYREMRTYGFREDAYRQAREAGVTFLRFDLEHKPQVTATDGGLQVRTLEPITGQELTLSADAVVLSTGIEPNDSRDLAEMLGLGLDDCGFFQEEHPKMRPLDFTQRGVFVCGLAHSPRAVDETIAMAEGAAMRAVSLLDRGAVEAQPTVAQVNVRLCSACGLCVDACPYDARVLEPGDPYAEVLETMCQGCGVCVAVCPNGASQQVGYALNRVYDMLDAVTTS